jgi:hypothetical protein
MTSSCARCMLIWSLCLRYLEGFGWEVHSFRVYDTWFFICFQGGCAFGFRVEVMGNSRNKEKQLGVIGGNLVKRAKVVECQWHPQIQRKELQKSSLQENRVEPKIVQEDVPNHEVRKVAKAILLSMKKTLMTFPNHDTERCDGQGFGRSFCDSTSSRFWNLF